MATGEGQNFGKARSRRRCSGALRGKGSASWSTANDYLARRDADSVGLGFLGSLGLSVGLGPQADEAAPAFRRSGESSPRPASVT